MVGGAKSSLPGPVRTSRSTRPESASASYSTPLRVKMVGSVPTKLGEIEVTRWPSTTDRFSPGWCPPNCHPQGDVAGRGAVEGDRVVLGRDHAPGGRRPGLVQIGLGGHDLRDLPIPLLPERGGEESRRGAFAGRPRARRRMFRHGGRSSREGWTSPSAPGHRDRTGCSPWSPRLGSRERLARPGARRWRSPRQLAGCTPGTGSARHVRGSALRARNRADRGRERRQAGLPPDIGLHRRSSIQAPGVPVRRPTGPHRLLQVQTLASRVSRTRTPSGINGNSARVVAQPEILALILPDAWSPQPATYCFPRITTTCWRMLTGRSRPGRC